MIAPLSAIAQICYNVPNKKRTSEALRLEGSPVIAERSQSLASTDTHYLKQKGKVAMLSLSDPAQNGNPLNLPPKVGTILRVLMPCGAEALAEVLWYYYRTHQPRLSSVIALRVCWLPSQDPYIRGYKLVYGRKIETIEGSVEFPANPQNREHGHVQMGEWQILASSAISTRLEVTR